MEAGAIGFDVVIDDTDGGSGRDTQMAWAGTAENYLNPAFYGALWLSRSPLRAHTRSPEYRIVFH